MKVLINLRSLEYTGGVVQIFKILALNKLDYIDYFIIGKPEYNRNPLYLLLRYIVFIGIVMKYNVIHLNPSFEKNALWRDLGFLKIAKIFRRKVIVFFHGWNEDYEIKVSNNPFLRSLFKGYNKANAIIILGSVFKDKLVNLGIQEDRKFYFETSIADDTYIEPDYIDKRLAEINGRNKINLLFISRIVKNKGLYLAISVFQKLKSYFQNEDIRLLIAGDGDLLSEIQEYVKLNKIEDIEFLGHVKNKVKDQVFRSSHLLLFPSFSEGLPNCIMESCLYGLPVVSREVGGIGDWIINGHNGYITDSKLAEEFAEKIKEIITDIEMFKMIARNNHNMATKNFVPVVVKNRILNIYSEVYNGG